MVYKANILLSFCFKSSYIFFIYRRISLKSFKISQTIKHKLNNFLNIYFCLYYNKIQSSEESPESLKSLKEDRRKSLQSLGSSNRSLSECSSPTTSSGNMKLKSFSVKLQLFYRQVILPFYKQVGKMFVIKWIFCFIL